MTQALIEGIVAHINSGLGATLRAAVTDWGVIIPPETAGPFFKIQMVDTGEWDETFDGNNEEPTIQFFIHSDDNESQLEAIVIYDLIVALFDDADITVSGYTVVRVDRQYANLFEDPTRGQNYVVRYKLYLDKQ